MSSTLPRKLRESILDAARVAPGYVRCAECGRIFPDSDVHVDHITPEANGGSHDPVNLQVLCAPAEGAGCHRLKTREEARERAAEPRIGLTPGRAGLAAVTGSAAVVSMWVGVKLWREESPWEALSQVRETITYAVLAAVAACVLMALMGIRRWLEPTLDLEEEEEEGEEPDSTSLAPRFAAALASLMGEEVSAVDEGEGVRVFYDSSFPDHDENTRFRTVKRVNMKIGGRWEPQWDGQSDSVLFTRRPDFPKLIRHPGLPEDQRWWLIPFSNDFEVDLSKTSHMLVIGKTNAGKTAFMRSAVYAGMHASRHSGVKLILADPKRVELVGFRGWPGVREVVTEDEDLWNMPIRLNAEMNERYRLFEEEGVKLKSHSPILVIIDEYEEYVRRMHAMWNEEDPKTKKPRRKTGQKIPPPISAMASILALARKCRIHVIIGTQRPDASWFGGSARDNMQARAAVGPVSRDAANMLFERSDCGRDLPADAKGRFSSQQLDGAIIESQAWYIPDPANADGENSQMDEVHLSRLKADLR